MSSLTGKRVVITRTPRQGAELVEKLSALGAVAISLPLVAFSAPEDFRPLDEALARIEEFDLVIFTSENAVRAVVKRGELRGYLNNVPGRRSRAAAVGPTTAAAAERAGFRVDFTASTHSGVDLANELGEKLRGESIFLPRSDHANEDLPEALRGFGAEVTEAVAYRTVVPLNLDYEKIAAIQQGEAEAILFFSPTAVEHFVEVIGAAALQSVQQQMALVAVGPITAAALQRVGGTDPLVAEDTTSDAVIAALEKYFADSAKPSAAGAHLS
jgi:uroporphyrinogen III methyltransferase / synthase